MKVRDRWLGRGMQPIQQGRETLNKFVKPEPLIPQTSGVHTYLELGQNEEHGSTSMG